MEPAVADSTGRSEEACYDENGEEITRKRNEKKTEKKPFAKIISDGVAKAVPKFKCKAPAFIKSSILPSAAREFSKLNNSVSSILPVITATTAAILRFLYTG